MSRPTDRFRMLIRGVVALTLAVASAAMLSAQTSIKATARAAPPPAWSKGIQPITSATYYDAIECGKRGGQDPPCVFWDTGLCKNPDFALAMYTPYKSVAYEVWRAVSAKQTPPTPNYQEAQRTRITIGVTPVRGSTNAFAGLTVKRGGRAVEPVDRSLSSGGGRFTFDFPAFAPTADVTLELAGKAGTVSCVIGRAVLAQFR